jgi:hypothetical protein
MNFEASYAESTSFGSYIRQNQCSGFVPDWNIIGHDSSLINMDVFDSDKTHYSEVPSLPDKFKYESKSDILSSAPITDNNSNKSNKRLQNTGPR